MALAQPVLRDPEFWPSKQTPETETETLQRLRNRHPAGVFSHPQLPFGLSHLGNTFDQLAIRFEEQHNTLWCGFRHPHRPCFTRELLSEIARLQAHLKHLCSAQTSGTDLPVRAVVWYSSLPDMWNLGGDLSLFIQLIRAGARDDLRRYAYACVDTVYQNWTKLGLPFVTVALVQGDALGGGFEAVLTNDIIIAERQSKFGLPEILFNMFPGMGAYSFLCRRLDGIRAEQMIRSGRLYEAEELATMGLVDLVVEQGEGAAAVREYLDRHRRRLAVWGALSQVRRRCQPISYEELIDVTEIWVDTAMDLEESDLRRMERLAVAQCRRQARARTDGLAATA